MSQTNKQPGRSIRMYKIWSIVLIFSMLVAMPFNTMAQVNEAPSGFLVLTATYGETLCPGDSIVYTIGLFDTSSAAVPAYQATITDVMPANTTFAGTDGSSDLSFSSVNNTLTWTPSVDPAQPPPLPPTASFTVTLGSAVSDGQMITNLASGTLGGITPVAAQVESIVNCTTEPPLDPEDYPTPAVEEPAAETPETTPMLENEIAVTEPATDSLLLEPEIGDTSPVGYFEVFLPSVVSSTPASAAIMGPPPPAARAAITQQSCAMVYPWVSRHAMTEAAYQADATKWDAANYRPIAVSANGSGSDARFATIWIKDGQYGKNWILRHNMDGAEYQQKYTDYKAAGYMLTVVDMYGTTASPRYVAIWVKNATLTLGSHGLGEASMQQQIDEKAALGYRPLWVSGLGSASNNSPAFSGAWVKDTLTGTLRINLTTEDIGAKGLARKMVNDGYHMTHLSGYTTLDGTRYAAVWVKGGLCPADRWEGFRDQTSTKYQIKASAQRKVSSIKTVAANTITLAATDIGGAFRIGRVSVRNTNGTPVELNRITSQLPVSNGTILVLQPEPGNAITMVERAAGNLRLRAWKPGAVGQSFGLNNYQYRLTLQYNAGLQKWVELDRNNISPDYYWPTSVDEYGASSARRYNSVWKAGPVDRVWRVTGIPAGVDPLSEFDQAMKTYMQRSNVPNGTLALAVNGKLVLARGYSWTPTTVPSVAPDAGFRLASVSKPLTAIAVMKLVQAGSLNLDSKIKDIPGFDAILQSNAWADDDIKKVTVRHLLNHTGGWDRDLAADPMLNDWNVCSAQNPKTLPTTFTSILDYTRTLPIEHEPGETSAYSNFGYALLGRIVEHVGGQPYATYMDNNVFAPVGANKTQLGSNFTQLPGEVTYYRPDNMMSSSVLGFGAGQPADRDVCNPSHANIAHVSYGGGHNIDPMAAHGGWVSTGVDLARVMVGLEQNTLISAASRNTMWSRPENRGQRVAVYDNTTKTYKDYTLNARTDSDSFTGIDSLGDIMYIGQGLTKFSKLDFTFTTPGQGYAVKLIYLKKSGGYGFLTPDNDGTLNLSQSGAATFTPPADWEASVISTIDPRPKFYVLAYTTASPGAATSIKKLTLNGEATYGLGWIINDVTNTLRFSNGTALLAPNAVIVGQLSKASAQIKSVSINPSTGMGTLTLGKVSGGSFWAAEKLLVGVAIAAKATEREWTETGDTGHGGLLWGTSASIKHLSNNVNIVVLLNQDSAYDPYWYLPSNTIAGDIEKLAKAKGSNWPAIDLFNQFP